MRGQEEGGKGEGEGVGGGEKKWEGGKKRKIFMCAAEEGDKGEGGGESYPPVYPSHILRVNLSRTSLTSHTPPSSLRAHHEASAQYT